ncbi:hypothetical protein RU639_005417 [Aspergillus parasiticus]
MTMRTREKSCKELEFRPCGSDLLVPRPFYQRGRRLKIEIASPGSLDTLYFTDDNVDTLGDDEIDMEVKATGLNFKDIVVTMA